MAVEPCWLLELDGYTDAGTSATYRISSDPEAWPIDLPAGAELSDRLIDPGSFSATLFAAGVAGVRSNPQAEVSWGLARAENIDGDLDSLFAGLTGVSFRERGARVLKMQPGALYATAELQLSATISQMGLTQEEVTIGLKDRLYELNSQHQTVLFAGNNSLPNGLEGVDDLKGKPKPLAYGKCYGIPLPCVNTSRLIHQASARAAQSVDAVYDGGNLLTAGAAYSSQADMETNAPSAGQYRVWLAASAVYIRFGTAPTYRPTADITADSAANSTCAQIIKRLIQDRGWSAGDISASDVTALDALEPGVLQAYVADTRTTLAVMAEVARGIASFWMSRLASLRLVRFAVPSGTASVVIDTTNCEAVEQLQSGEDVPTCEIRVRYAKYWDVQKRTEVAAAVTEARKADLGEEWRISTATSTPSPNPHKRLQAAEIDTAYTAKADADAAAARLLALTDVPRRTFVLRGVGLEPDELDALDLGNVIELRWPRYGFSEETGNLLRVIGLTYSLGSRRCELTVWGS